MYEEEKVVRMHIWGSTVFMQPHADAHALMYTRVDKAAGAEAKTRAGLVSPRAPPPPSLWG